MQIIRGLHNIHRHNQACVATIGNFDGVHLGHQAVLKQLRERAEQLNLPSVLVTFEPQPREFFSPQTVPARLTRFREKLECLQDHGLHGLLCIQFNKRFAQRTADDFVKSILVEGLAVRHLVIGDDFRFGKHRQGDFDCLKRLGTRYGFEVERTCTLELDAQRVSSTRVRDALQNANMPLAKRLLGRDYAMSGRVAHGNKIGRTLGFPTANIHVHRQKSPIGGIFAVRMRGIGDKPLPGVANIGTRPVVCGKRTLLEVYLLDFDRDIYGQHVSVEFLHKFREEVHFDSMQALQQQIEQDVRDTRAFFAGRGG